MSKNIVLCILIFGENFFAANEATLRIREREELSRMLTQRVARISCQIRALEKTIFLPFCGEETTYCRVEEICGPREEKRDLYLSDGPCVEKKVGIALLNHK